MGKDRIKLGQDVSSYKDCVICIRLHFLFAEDGGTTMVYNVYDDDVGAAKKSISMVQRPNEPKYIISAVYY